MSAKEWYWEDAQKFYVSRHASGPSHGRDADGAQPRFFRVPKCIDSSRKRVAFSLPDDWHLLVVEARLFYDRLFLSTTTNSLIARAGVNGHETRTGERSGRALGSPSRGGSPLKFTLELLRFSTADRRTKACYYRGTAPKAVTLAPTLGMMTEPPEPRFGRSVLPERTTRLQHHSLKVLVVHQQHSLSWDSCTHCSKPYPFFGTCYVTLPQGHTIAQCTSRSRPLAATGSGKLPLHY